MESIAESFDLTNEQVRALGEKLGIDIQTNLERMAVSLGLNVEQMRELGAAVSEEYGVPMEEVSALLEAMGVSAQDLAKALGLDFGDVEDATKSAVDNTGVSADNATRYADESERGAAAWNSVDTKNFPSVISGLPPGFQHGGRIPANPPLGTTIRVGEKEGETIVPDSKMGSMGNVTNTFNITIPVDAVVADEDVAQKIAGAVGLVIKDKLGDAVGNMEEAMEGTFQRS